MRNQLLMIILVLVMSSFQILEAREISSHQDEDLVRLTTQSMLEVHRIFSESWRLLIGDGVSSPNSAMKILSLKLTNTKHTVSKNPCQKDEEHLEYKKHNETFELKLSKRYCQTQIESHMATWTWKKDLKEFEFLASPNQLTEGIGESLSMLNRSIKCKASLSENKNISKLSCENLGQGLSRSTHVLFNKFEYDTKSDNLLVVEADRYENLFQKIGCDSKEPCLKMIVPSLGLIKIVENRKKKVETVAQNPIPVAPVPAAVPPTTEVTENQPTGDENSELQMAGYKPEDLQEAGAPEQRVNPVYASEGPNSGQGPSIR